jgi:hypothetical protein
MISTLEAQVLEAQPVQQHQAPAVIQAQAITAQAMGLPPAVITPADLLRVAMDSGDKDIDRLERLMAMDERYRDSQERDRQRQSVLAFRRDFAGFRGENVLIPKTKFVDRGKAGSFFQAEYDLVCSKLSPALSKHGFGFRHGQKFGSLKWVNEDGIECQQAWVWVTCFLEHRDGHVETLELEGPPGDLGGNTPVQNMQATASYLKRQSLLAITGTATGGEDDESLLLKREAGDTPPPVDPKSYPQDSFDKNLAAWKKLITEGTKTAEQVIKTVQSKAPMTAQQMQALRAISPTTQAAN